MPSLDATGRRRLTRRRFLQMAAALVATTGVVAGYGRYGEPNWVHVEEIVLHVPNLPPRSAGTRLAQISDIHLGAYFTAERLLQAIERVNQLSVGWLLLTGDFVSLHSRSSELRAAAAATLVEPLRHAQIPSFASIGNHDLWGGLEPIEHALHEAGITILRNAAAPLEAGLWLAGVDDLWSGRPDLHAALRDVPADGVTLLMAHEPDYFDTVLAQDAPVAAQVSGHSHGGQIRYPLPVPGPDGTYSLAFMVPTYSERYPIGLRQRNNRYVYTNRGLGAWPIPYRINCPPEITVFTLQPPLPG